MINSISIQNYALIKELDINLSPGLNIITGETGAGKSIIIDALSLLLGGRANRDNIRHGEQKMKVSALFDLSDTPEIKPILEEYGIEIENDQLILFREIDKKGKNICRANGMIVPLNLFKALSANLIDIHSQHEHVSLFQNDNQRILLDKYSGQEAISLLEQIKSQTQNLKKLAKRIKELQKQGKEAARQFAMDKFQLEEINKAELTEDEDLVLEEEVKSLERGEKLFDRAYQTSNLISNDINETSLSDILSDLDSRLEQLAREDEWFKPHYEQIRDIASQINNLSYDLTSYIDKLDFDPLRLSEVHNRLDTIDNLKKKYGDSVKEILSYAKELEEKVSLFENADDLLDQAKDEYSTARKTYNSNANMLTDLRIEASGKLKEELESELHELAMEKAVFEVAVDTDKELISANGQDTISFLISVNPGQEPKELKRVASGGEISRIMLAIKGIFGDKDAVGTMIFDEIDTGISGRTAQVVAEKISKLSRKRQIICITHLPQIAAMADNQFLVQKDTKVDSTEVSFKELDHENRILELSRMLGGAEVTDLTEQHAREMIEQANIYKNIH